MTFKTEITAKPYAGLMVTLVDRDSGHENKIMLYPARRVELIEMPIEPSGAEKLRVFVPLDNMNGDLMGWREE
jgi:hypothetical protein